MNLEASIVNLERRKRDLESYSFIINNCYSTDVSCDEAFQRKFTHFYRVRRNSIWRKSYYQLFENSKSSEKPSFEVILRSIYESTGRIEASFSSKMLATINSEMPIWDSIVLSKLHLKLAQNSEKEVRLQKATVIYADIVRWYERFLCSAEAQVFLSEFDQAFPEYVGFSKTKKVDFLIWSSGDTDLFTKRY